MVFLDSSFTLGFYSSACVSSIDLIAPTCAEYDIGINSNFLY